MTKVYIKKCEKKNLLIKVNNSLALVSKLKSKKPNLSPLNLPSQSLGNSQSPSSALPHVFRFYDEAFSQQQAYHGMNKGALFSTDWVMDFSSSFKASAGPLQVCKVLAHSVFLDLVL